MSDESVTNFDEAAVAGGLDLTVVSASFSSVVVSSETDCCFSFSSFACFSA